VELRRAVRDDIDVIVWFVDAMLQDMASYGGHPLVEARRRDRLLRAHVDACLVDADHLLLLAVPGGAGSEPLGLVEASVTGLDELLRPKRVLHIHALYVEPGHRRQGVGRALLEAALAWGKERGCQEAALNALIGNPASHLYRATGFQAFQVEMRRRF
jgi:GNAT superfamily N-acetyltransferase